MNASTGKLNWYYQATPSDDHDWDLGTPPTLYRTRSGQSMLAIAGKDGHVWGLDRTTHKLIFKTTGTTIANDDPVDETLKRVCPGSIGGAQWNGTAYHPELGLIFTGMVDWCFYYSTKNYTGAPGFREVDVGYPGGRKESEEATVHVDFSKQPRGWITAMDGETGRVVWKYHADAQVLAGLVPTKSGLLFAGDTRGNLLAFDAKSGSVLKHIDAKGALNNGLISYDVEGTQYIAAAVGGLTLNCAGVSGPLRVTIYGLHGSDTPKTVKLERFSLTKPAHLFALVCGNCHGWTGQGSTAPSLVRQTQMRDAEHLKAFLKSVPPPMPILYPGLLEEHEVELIAEHLKVITRHQNSEKSGSQDAPASSIPSATKGAYAGPSANATATNTGGTEAGGMAGPREWQQIYSVLTSSRCINCHTMTNYPRQGDDRHPHIFGVVRGVDDKGAPVARCSACHGDQNNAATGIPGRSDWHAAPLANAWETAPGVIMTPAELCAQMKDLTRNGNRTMAQLIDHVDTEHFVLWAWDPGIRWNGEPRQTPPLSHQAFVKAFKGWAAAGAACPAASAETIQASSKR